MLNIFDKSAMDFLCFTANHGHGYAINIEDLLFIIDNPVITSVPGTLPAIVGMTMFRGDLIPVVDMTVMYSGDNDATEHKMIVFNTASRVGVLVTEINEIVRNDVPDGYEFLDVRDFERQITTTDTEAHESHIELF